MNAKKCDRCGNYYDHDANTKIALNPKLDGVLVNTAFGFDCEYIYDLCDDCAESFDKWMHPKEKLKAPEGE